jgi:hypothetical protein
MATSPQGSVAGETWCRSGATLLCAVTSAFAPECCDADRAETEPPATARGRVCDRERTQHCPTTRSRLGKINGCGSSIFRSRIVGMRGIAAMLVILLLPLQFKAVSAMACSMPSCCANCMKAAPVNQASCCRAPAVPEKATSSAPGAQSFQSIVSLRVTAVMAVISHLQSAAITQGYSPPERLASLSLLCSRQI